MEDRKLRAVVFFEDSGLLILRPFAAGFRHVVVAVEGAYGGVAVIHPASNVIDVTPGPREFDDYVVAMIEDGCRCLVGEMVWPSRPSYFRLLTCVEVVKRIIGVDDPFVFTPRQLYRRLLKNGWRAPGNT